MTQISLVNAAQSIFEDGKFYLSQLNSQQYSQKLDIFSGASIGQHTRHWIEFFHCLLHNAIASQTVSYDKRKRNPVWENDPEAAIAIIEEMEAMLIKYPEIDQLTLESEMSDQIQVLLPTSFPRELWFVIEHAVHHLAIIKIGLKTEFPDWVIPTHFGVATSTLAQQELVESRG